MEIGQLQAFERAAREGSFTRAGEAMGLTQPAVSTRITTLEAELGGPLFERRGRELRLTALGEHLLPYVQRLLALYDDTKQAAYQLQTGRAGQVKLAAPTPFVLGYLVKTLAHFRRRHPTIDILIRERNKTVIFDLIRDGTMALGLVNAPVYDREMAQIVRLQDPVRAVAAHTHPLAAAGRDTIPMDALYAHTIYRVSMFPQMTAFVDEVAEQARSGSGGAVVAVPMVMALRLVTMGQGITFLPESYVRHSVNANELVYLNVEGIPPLVSEPVLIAHRERTLDQANDAFVQTFLQDWRHLIVRS
jgi:DNA-binding transcriptional LysR family regulator